MTTDRQTLRAKHAGDWFWLIFWATGVPMDAFSKSKIENIAGLFGLWLAVYYYGKLREL